MPPERSVPRAALQAAQAACSRSLMMARRHDWLASRGYRVAPGNQIIVIPKALPVSSIVEGTRHKIAQRNLTQIPGPPALRQMPRALQPRSWSRSSDGFSDGKLRRL